MVHSSAKARGKRPAREGGSGSANKKKKSGGFDGGGSGRGRKGGGGVKEVIWDDEARREYLTGFSKRKKEKKDAAKARALVKEKEAKLAMRQELRDARKEQARTNVEAAKEYYGGNEADDVAGPSGDVSVFDAEPEEQEYANEEMTSRVVIEDFKLDGESSEEEEAGDEDEDIDMDGPNSNMFAAIAPQRVKKQQAKLSGAAAPPKVRENPFVTPNDSPAKPKPKKFTYETKNARKAAAMKQKAKRMERAQDRKSATSSARSGRGASGGSRKRGGKR